MMEEGSSVQSSTILFLTYARTASHVLERMLSQQPNVLYGADWFVSTRQLRRNLLKAGPIDQTDPTVRKELMETLEESYSWFLGFLDNAEQHGRTAFANTQPHAMISPTVASDHVYGDPDLSHRLTPGLWMVASSHLGKQAHTNPTVLPDSALLRPGTVPILNFRHPILVCDGPRPSATR